MPSAAKSAVAPLYLLLCLLFGGSAQGIWQNAALQLIGLGIILWAVIARSEKPLSQMACRLFILAAVGIAVVALQCMPLPPSIWAHGAREPLASGYRLLGMPVPWLPISVTPYGSLSNLLCLIPPLAIFAAIVRLHAYRPSWLAAALLTGAVAGIALGALQAMNAGTASQWYLYPRTNVGRAVGFFANASHMAILLVISAPFVAALAAAGRGREIQYYSALSALLFALGSLLVVGIALSGSLAGWLLSVPVVFASSLILLRRRSRSGPWLALLAGVSIVAAIGVLATSSIGGQLISKNAATSVQSRAEITTTTFRAIGDFMPWGSGLGSFAKVYHLYENPDAVTNEYVVHAHNDYAELLLELGIAGAVLIALFLIWWGHAVWKSWRRPDGSPFTYAASIASAALLVHSFVEFPLRTAAMSACFAMCIGLLANGHRLPRKEAADLRPARHIVIR